MINEDKAGLIEVARGERPADIIMANARVVNVFNGEIEEGNVAVYHGVIAGVGDYKEAKEVIYLKGKYLAPGFISGHIHIESSMLDIGQYARAAVARGTLAIITDLHELANVCGLKGIEYILNYASKLPLEVFLMAPSCVPATHLETSGACVSENDIKKLLEREDVLGLGEMMNYPGVLMADEIVMGKLAVAKDKVIDGHAPGVSGGELNAYITAGIRSDHESVTFKEGQEKLRKGMHLMIREGSSEKNLETLLPLVTDKTYKRCLLVVDDRSCSDLLRDGDMDAVIRKAVRLGLDPVRAIQLATINTAEYFNLKDLGAIGPGYRANMVVIDNLADLNVEMALYDGKIVARKNKALFKTPKSKWQLGNTINIKPFRVADLELKSKKKRLPVIELVPGQIITRRINKKVKSKDDIILTDIDRDILKLVVVERHKASGNIGLGLVKGFGLKNGALVSSIAHDSHNIIAVGTSDDDIYEGIKEIEKLGGGLAVVSRGKVLASLALPIGGLMSGQPLEDVVAGFEELKCLADELGVKVPSPFAALSFLALPVIPELRLTDKGLVDVNSFKIIDIC